MLYRETTGRALARRWRTYTTWACIGRAYTFWTFGRCWTVQLTLIRHSPRNRNRPDVSLADV